MGYVRKALYVAGSTGWCVRVGVIPDQPRITHKVHNFIPYTTKQISRGAHGQRSTSLIVLNMIFVCMLIPNSNYYGKPPPPLLEAP